MYPFKCLYKGVDNCQVLFQFQKLPASFPCLLIDNFLQKVSKVSFSINSLSSMHSDFATYFYYLLMTLLFQYEETGLTTHFALPISVSYRSPATIVVLKIPAKRWQGHFLTAYTAASPGSPHRLQNPKWPLVSPKIADRVWKRGLSLGFGPFYQLLLNKEGEFLFVYIILMVFVY